MGEDADCSDSMVSCNSAHVDTKPNLPRYLTPTVQHLDSRRKSRLRIGRLPDLRKVPALLQHAERRTECQIANDVEGEVVEPVQGVHLVPATFLRGRALVPLLLQEFEVVVHVLLELADGFGGEGVRDRLALAGVFSAVAGVEEAAADGDEGVVVFTERKCCQYKTSVLVLDCLILPLQHPIAMAVDDGNRIRVCDAHVVRLDPDHRPVLLVRIVDGQVAVALTALEEKPEIGECCWKWRGDVFYLPVADVR